MRWWLVKYVVLLDSDFVPVALEGVNYGNRSTLG